MTKYFCCHTHTHTHTLGTQPQDHWSHESICQDLPSEEAELVYNKSGTLFGCRDPGPTLGQPGAEYSWPSLGCGGKRGAGRHSKSLFSADTSLPLQTLRRKMAKKIFFFSLSTKNHFFLVLMLLPAHRERFIVYPVQDYHSVKK